MITKELLEPAKSYGTKGRVIFLSSYLGKAKMIVLVSVFLIRFFLWTRRRRSLTVCLSEHSPTYLCVEFSLFVLTFIDISFNFRDGCSK